MAADDASLAWLSPLDGRRNDIILRAACEVFAARGLENALIVDIAARARVSKETLYARYDSKERLFQAVLAWVARSSPIDPEQFGEDRDPLTALGALAVAWLGAVTRPEALAVARIAAASGSAEIGQAYLEGFYQPAAAIARRLATRLNQTGQARVTDASAFADALIGVLGAKATPLLVGAAQSLGQDELTAHAHASVDLVMRAHRPRSRSRNGEPRSEAAHTNGLQTNDLAMQTRAMKDEAARSHGAPDGGPHRADK